MTCTQCVQWANRRSIHRRVMRSWLHVWMLISHLGYEPPPSRPRSSVSEDICGCSSGISPSKSSWHWRFAADPVVPPVIVHSAWTHTGMTGAIPLHNPPVSLRALVVMSAMLTLRNEPCKNRHGTGTIWFGKQSVLHGRIGSTVMRAFRPCCMMTPRIEPVGRHFQCRTKETTKK